ncbi:hypothetical protein Tco_0389310 [Tanacetum coccineum]
MNRISSRRSSTTTWVHWQCSQNISWVGKGKGLFGPNGGSGGKFEKGFGENVGSGRSSSVSKVGAGGREVKGGGVVLGEPIDNRWVVREDDKEEKPIEGWRSNTDEH